MELNATCDICGKREHDPDPEPLEYWQVWLCDECAGVTETSSEVGEHE